MQKITKEMSINQVLSMDRTTAGVFMSHGMFCLGCPHAQAESIEDAGAVHGIDVDALVEALNQHIQQ